MKKTELRKLVKKNILPLLNDYMYHKDILIKSIDGFILRGFGFEVSSFGKVAIIPFFQPLYMERENFVWTFGNRIRDRDNREWWDLENEDNILYLVEMLNAIDEKMLSKVVNSLDLYNLFKSDEEKGLRYEEALAFTACKADLDIADNIFHKQIQRIEDEGKDYDWILTLKSKYELFLRLNKEERHNKLSEWENLTIKNLNLEELSS